MNQSYFFFFFLALLCVFVVISCVIRCRVIASRRLRQQRIAQQEAQANEAAAYSQQYFLFTHGGGAGNGGANMGNDGAGGTNYYAYTTAGNGINTTQPQAGTVLAVSDTNGAGNGILGPQALPLAQFFPEAHVVEYHNGTGNQATSVGTAGNYYSYANAPPQLLSHGEGADSTACGGGNGQGAGSDPYGTAAYLPRHPGPEGEGDGTTKVPVASTAQPAGCVAQSEDDTDSREDSQGKGRAKK